MQIRFTTALLLAICLFVPSLSAFAGEAKDLYKCDMCGGQLGVNCCCMKKSTPDEECRSARAWVSEHVPEPNRSACLKSNDCNYARNVAGIWGWKSQSELRRQAEWDRDELDRKAKNEADWAKQKAKSAADSARWQAESDARLEKMKSDNAARLAKMKADNDALRDNLKQRRPANPARDVFDKANQLQKDLDNGIIPARPRQSNPGLGDPGDDPAPPARPFIRPESTEPPPDFEPVEPLPRRVDPPADIPSPQEQDPPPGQDPDALRRQQMANELLDLAKQPHSVPQVNFDDLVPSRPAANSPRSNFDDLAPTRSNPGAAGQPKDSTLSNGDLINGAKAGIGAYRNSGEGELPNFREEALKQGLKTVSPPTPAQVAAQAVHDQNNKLAKEYGLTPTDPQKSQAAKMADRFLDLLPGSQAKSNVGDLTKLRDEGVGLIGTIGQAVDKLFHASDEKKSDQDRKPAFQDLLNK